jgi:hypothetical protein
MVNARCVNGESPTAAAKEPLSVITVRLKRSLHTALVEEAYQQRKSLNLLCIERLRQISARSEFHALAIDQAEWSQATFGPDERRGPIGALKHLEKEAREAQQDPCDPYEFADCLLLVLDAARRAGINASELIQFAEAKMAINKERTWPKPTSDEPVEHVRGCKHDTDGDGNCAHHPAGCPVS